MTSPGAAPEPTDPAPGAPAGAPPGAAQEAAVDPTPAPGAAKAAGAPAARVAPASESMLPEQSPEDTDAAWGEYRPRDEDRLYRDRPPHWDDF